MYAMAPESQPVISSLGYIQSVVRQRCRKYSTHILSRVNVIITIIGVILRDSHGVAQVRFVTGSKILRILKAKSLAPAIPEDLYHLVKKAVAIRRHLERNRKVRTDQR